MIPHLDRLLGRDRLHFPEPAYADPQRERLHKRMRADEQQGYECAAAASAALWRLDLIAGTNSAVAEQHHLDRLLYSDRLYRGQDECAFGGNWRAEHAHVWFNHLPRD